MHHYQLFLFYMHGLPVRSIAIQKFEAVAKLAVLHIVECIHFLLELADLEAFFGEEGLRRKLLQLLILNLLEEKVLLNV